MEISYHSKSIRFDVCMHFCCACNAYFRGSCFRCLFRVGWLKNPKLMEPIAFIIQGIVQEANENACSVVRIENSVCVTNNLIVFHMELHTNQNSFHVTPSLDSISTISVAKMFCSTHSWMKYDFAPGLFLLVVIQIKFIARSDIYCFGFLST